MSACVRLKQDEEHVAIPLSLDVSTFYKKNNNNKNISTLSSSIITIAKERCMKRKRSFESNNSFYEEKYRQVECMEILEKKREENINRLITINDNNNCNNYDIGIYL